MAGLEERLKRERMYVYLRQIHVVLDRNQYNTVEQLPSNEK